MKSIHTQTQQVAIIGVGGTGAAVLDNLAVACEGEHRTIAIDTDALALRGTVAAKKILVAPERVHGMGTGGEWELLEGLSLEEGDSLDPILGGISTAIVIFSASGGTGSALGSGLIKRLKKQKTDVVVMAVTPFAFEGSRKKERAIRSLHEVRKVADAVLVFSNERLLECSLGKDLREGQRGLDRALARTVHGLVHVMSRDGLVHLGVAELKEAVGTGADAIGLLENAWTGVAEASGEGREEAVIEAVCEDILLEDGRAWKDGNRVLVSVITGPETSLNDFHGLLEKLRARLPVNLPISAGAAVDPEKSESISITLLVTRRGEDSVLPKLEELSRLSEPSKQEVEAVVAKGRRKRKFIAAQGELEFDQTPSRFAQSSPTVRGAEDLDRPTFQRRGIVLRATN
jgi:cell division protein FtsZ